MSDPIYGDTGPTGPTGDKGEPGIGIKGNSGEKGYRGERGDTGPTGEKGPQGPKGLCVAGEKGPQGDTGPRGGTGEKGFRGVYFDGALGPKGPAGEKGEQGPVGAEGIFGDPGDEGDMGPEGPQGPQGDQGPAGEQGIVGDKGLVGNKGDSGIQGPVGQQGDPGAQGARGAKGLIGDKGDVGAQGTKGPAGQQGLAGPTGEKGNKNSILVSGPGGIGGDQGGQGDQGDQGPTGPTGQRGATGVQGEFGDKGIQGTVKGEQGERGVTGDKGLQGYNGLRGPVGSQGEQGPTGPEGPAGPQGPQGASRSFDGWQAATNGVVGGIHNNSTKYTSVGIGKDADSQYALDVSGTMHISEGSGLKLDGVLSNFVDMSDPMILSLFQVEFVNDAYIQLTPSNPIAANMPIFKLVVGNYYNCFDSTQSSNYLDKLRQTGYKATHINIGINEKIRLGFYWFNVGSSQINQLTFNRNSPSQSPYIHMHGIYHLIPVSRIYDSVSDTKLMKLQFTRIQGEFMDAKYPKSNNFNDYVYNQYFDDGTRYANNIYFQHGEVTTNPKFEELSSYPEGDTTTQFICIDEVYDQHYIDSKNNTISNHFFNPQVLTQPPGNNGYSSEWLLLSPDALYPFSANFQSYKPEVDFYCAGSGYTNPAYLAKYNPSTEQWTAVTATNGSQIDGAVTGMIYSRYSRKLFISGDFTTTGGVNGFPTNGNLCLNIPSNTWINMGSPSGSVRCTFTQMQLDNTSAGLQNNTDILNRNWKQTAQEFLGRDATKIYMCGPGDISGNNKVAIYNINPSGVGTWTKLGKMPNGNVMCVSIDHYDNVLFVGGDFTEVYNVDASGNVIETIQSRCMAYYDLSASKWCGCGNGGLTHTDPSVTPFVKFITVMKTYDSSPSKYVKTICVYGKFNKTFSPNIEIGNLGRVTYDLAYNKFLLNNTWHNQEIANYISNPECFINNAPFFDVFRFPDSYMPFSYFTKNEDGLLTFQNSIYTICNFYPCSNTETNIYYISRMTDRANVNGVFLNKGEVKMFVYMDGSWQNKSF